MKRYFTCAIDPDGEITLLCGVGHNTLVEAQECFSQAEGVPLLQRQRVHEELSGTLFYIACLNTIECKTARH